MASVKDSFRLGGRREESQREVKELDIEFRKEGRSTAGSEVELFLLGTGTARDLVACSGVTSKSTSAGLDECKRDLGGVWL